jgi:hypothetical protein
MSFLPVAIAVADYLDKQGKAATAKKQMAQEGAANLLKQNAQKLGADTYGYGAARAQGNYPEGPSPMEPVLGTLRGMSGQPMKPESDVGQVIGYLSEMDQGGEDRMSALDMDERNNPYMGSTIKNRRLPYGGGTGY